MTRVFLRDRRVADTDMHRRLYEDGGRDCSDPDRNAGAGDAPEVGRGKEWLLS